MNFLRSAVSLIQRNSTIQLHSLRQSRSFCTAKSESNGNNRAAISERNDDRVTNDQSKPLEKEHAIQSNLESGILISAYHMVGGI